MMKMYTLFAYYTFLLFSLTIVGYLELIYDVIKKKSPTIIRNSVQFKETAFISNIYVELLLVLPWP